jgi:NAD(P)-dependent dehydrogenase (short-subunit alcohol dehydrogenase family)
MSVALITGCSTGIGMETALHFAGLGHTVYASMRNPTRGQALRDAAAARKVSLQVIPLDVTDGGSIERAVKVVMARAGQLDILVNNAVSGGRTGERGSGSENGPSVTRRHPSNVSYRPSGCGRAAARLSSADPPARVHRFVRAIKIDASVRWQ